MKSNILLVAPFISLKGEPYFNRFRYLAQKFTEQGYAVTLVTSNFEHFTKQFRSKDTEGYQEGYNIIFMSEPGYSSNVSIKRFKSHSVFCQNLQKYLLSNTVKFDLIYSAYPLICSNIILGEYAKKNTIPFVIDIQDIWPESIAPALGKTFFLFKPLIKLISYRADKAYKSANALVAVSQTYLDRGLLNSTPRYSSVAYIGADVTKIQDIPPIHKNENEFWIVYVGTLSHSYDLMTVIESAKLLQDKYENIKFFIIGKGKDENKLQALNKELSAKVTFIDAMPYDDMVSYLKQADLGLNAISKYALGSITNKISDYICTQIPVLNSSENKEIMDLIDTNKVGVNYKSFNPKDLTEKIEFLYENPKILQNFRENLLNLHGRFDRKYEYEKIFQLVNNLIKEKNV